MRTQRRGWRSLARVTTALAVMAGVGATAVTTAAPAQAATNYTINLYASATDIAPGDYVYLEAYVTPEVVLHDILIYEQDTGQIVADCSPYTYYCSTDWYHYGTEVHTYVAYVGDLAGTAPANVQGASTPVTVRWGAASLGFTLKANPPVTTVGNSVTLDATMNVGAYAYIWIFEHDTGTFLTECEGNISSCSTSVTKTAAESHTYIAYATNYNWYYPENDPPYAPHFTSNTADVKWVVQPTVPPSGGVASNACDGGQQVVDSTVEGVHTKVYVKQPSGNETDVCVRAENLSNSLGVGGEFVITPTVPGAGVNGLGIPSTDTNVAACTTTTPNSVPGSHPITQGGVAGTSYVLDAYASGSAAWVCVKVGTNVSSRVKVPVSVPSPYVTPGTQVHFVPDPGTPALI